MGNEYGRRKGRPRAEVLRRFWRTSIFITYSIFGFKHGVENEHLLNDIGLTRDDVLDEINKPFWR